MYSAAVAGISVHDEQMHKLTIYNSFIGNYIYHRSTDSENNFNTSRTNID